MNERINGTKQVNVSFGKLGEAKKGKIYKQLKTEYKKQKSVQDKSDMANSPVIISEQFKMLKKLRETAQNENLNKEIEWVDKQIIQLSGRIFQTNDENLINEYKDFKESISKSNDEDFTQDVSEDLMKLMPVYTPVIPHQDNQDEIINKYTDENGNLDPQAEKLITIASKDDKIDLNLLNALIEYCEAEPGKFDSACVYAVEIMAANGIKPKNIPYYLENIYSTQTGKVDFVKLKGCMEFHAKGVDDITTMHFQNYINSKDFDDVDTVKDCIVRLYNADAQVDPDNKMHTSTVINIIDMLKKQDEKTNKFSIDSRTVNLVARLKSILTKSRHKEQKEYQSPLNTKKENYETVDMLNSAEDKDYAKLKRQYEEISQENEEKLLLKFIEKYTNSDKKIDSKYIRIANQLKEDGILNEKLLDLMDYCIDSEGDPDNDKLAAIKTLKQAGVLSKDLQSLTDICEDKTADSKEIKTICQLSQAVIPADDVKYFLPTALSSEDVCDFIQNTYTYFNNKEDIMLLINMCRNSDNEIDENALSIVDNLFFNADTNLRNEEFTEIADEILTIARISSYEISDEAAGICSIMSKNNSTPDEIKQGLLLCLDNQGIFDEKLSDLLWDLSSSKLNFDNSEIFEILKYCKTDKMEIDYDRIEQVNSLLKSDFDKVVIKSLILG